jgi:hypothetical protein
MVVKGKTLTNSSRLSTGTMMELWTFRSSKMQFEKVAR